MLHAYELSWNFQVKICALLTSILWSELGLSWMQSYHYSWVPRPKNLLDHKILFGRIYIYLQYSTFTHNMTIQTAYKPSAQFTCQYIFSLCAKCIQHQLEFFYFFIFRIQLLHQTWNQGLTYILMKCNCHFFVVMWMHLNERMLKKCHIPEVLNNDKWMMYLGNSCVIHLVWIRVIWDST